MQIIEMKVADLKPYKNNPRKNEEAVQPVMDSIKAVGFRRPLLIDKDNVIICGHTRLLAAKRLGMETVPCISAADMTEEQVRAYRVIDNKTEEIATWDDDLLQQELDNIQDIDMSLFGFDLSGDEEAEAEEEDIEPEIPFTEELLEENNYVVLFFDNSIDWLQAQSVLGITQAKALDSKEGFQRVGTGRVIDGTKFIERLMQDEH